MAITIIDYNSRTPTRRTSQVTYVERSPQSPTGKRLPEWLGEQGGRAASTKPTGTNKRAAAMSWTGKRTASR